MVDDAGAYSPYKNKALMKPRRSDKRSVIRHHWRKWWMTLALIHPTKQSLMKPRSSDKRSAIRHFQV